jgi:hypothetical protein
METKNHIFDEIERGGRVSGGLQLDSMPFAPVMLF